MGKILLLDKQYLEVLKLRIDFTKQDYYIVEIDKCFYDKKKKKLVFILKDNAGVFRFNYPKDKMIRYYTPLGRFLHLTEDKYLETSTIKDIVSTIGEIDSYIVPESVKYIKK